MQVTYHGKQYTVVDFARSTVLPEEFILLQGHGEYLVAPTHDLSGLMFPPAVQEWINTKWRLRA